MQKKRFSKKFFRARGFREDSIENERQVRLRSFKRQSKYQQVVYLWHIKTKKSLKKFSKKKREVRLRGEGEGEEKKSKTLESKNNVWQRLEKLPVFTMSCKTLVC
jgi:hypothetical protein